MATRVNLAANARPTATAFSQLRTALLSLRLPAALGRLVRARATGDILAIATMLVAVVSLTLARLGHPAQLAQTDLMSYFLPVYTYLGERLQAGDIPAWNPRQFSGAPFAGNPESGWMYLPAMVIFWLWPPLTAIKAYVLTHVVLSALATYAFGRVLGFRPLAAATAGAALSGNLVIVHASCCTVFAQVETWFPVTLLGVELALRGGKRAIAGGWLLTGLGVSQLFGAWMGQGAYYGLMVLGTYLAFRTLIAPPPHIRSPLARVRALVLHGTVMVGLGVGLVAAGLLPRLDALGQSTLAGGDYSGTGKATPEDVGWPPLYLASRILDDSASRRDYLGAAVLVLAIAAPFVARRRAIALYFAALTSGSAVLAMESTWLHDLFYRLPGFETLQVHVPNRILVITVFGAAVLVGATIDGIGRSRWRLALLAIPALGAAWLLRLLIDALPAENRPISDATVDAATIAVAVLLAASLGALPFVWRNRGADVLIRWAVPIILLGVVLWDPTGRWWMDASAVNKTGTSPLVERHAASAAELGGAAAFLAARGAEGPVRFFSFHPELATIGRGGCCDYHKHVLDPTGEATLVGNRALGLGLQDIQGYDPVQDARYYSYIHVLNGRDQDYHEAGIMPEGLESPLLDMLNARYAVVPAGRPPADQPELAKLIQDWPTVYKDEQVLVLENPDALPRAWIVHEADRVTREQALTRLLDPEFDPRERALVELSGVHVDPAGEPAEDRATVTSYEPDRITLEARSDAPGFLVLSEVYNPGWTAYVDGEEVQLYRANYLFRGVELPSGAHDIEFRYEPASLQTGLMVSSVAAVGSLGLAFFALGGMTPLLATWHALQRAGHRIGETARRERPAPRFDWDGLAGRVGAMSRMNPLRHHSKPGLIPRRRRLLPTMWYPRPTSSAPAPGNASANSRRPAGVTPPRPRIRIAPGLATQALRATDVPAPIGPSAKLTLPDLVEDPSRDHVP